MNTPMYDDDYLDENGLPIQGEVVGAGPTPVAAPVAPAINPAIAAYLQNKEALKSAQSKANDNQFLASMARAGSTLSGAIAGAGPQDQSAFNALDKEASAPVDKVLAQQAFQSKDLANQSAAMANDKEAANNDPNSKESQAFRSALAGFPDVVKAYGDNFDNLTAADKTTVFDIIKTKEMIASRQQTAQIAAQTHRDTFEASKDAKQQRQDTADIRAANTLTNSVPIQREITKMNAASGARSLIDSINSGELTDSSNVSHQLTNIIATIELGSPGGAGDRQAMGVNTLYGKAKELESWISGHPTSVIPKDYIDQLSHETDALGDRAASNYQKLTNAALAGSDTNLDPEASKGTVYRLVKQRQKSFLEQNGYDPETGLRKGKSSGSGSSAASSPDTKTVNGVTYKKVPGGWEEVPNG